MAGTRRADETAVLEVHSSGSDQKSLSRVLENYKRPKGTYTARQILSLCHCCNVTS